MFKEKWQKAVLDHAEAETIQNLKLPILRVELAALRMRMAAAQCVSMPSVSMKPLQPEGRAMGELLSNL